MTTAYIIKKLSLHGYKVSRCMSGRIALEKKNRPTIICDNYATAYRIAREMSCGAGERWTL